MKEESIKPATPLEEALLFASQVHASQVRKSTHIPYISHLLSVAALVMEDGGSQTEVLAALLHDAVEDGEGMQTYQQIFSLFGQQVADVVMECSDTTEKPKPPWQERKERYIAHLQNASQEALRVSLADKVHNARSILRDLQEGNGDVWLRFNGGKEGTMWYYQTLRDVFKQRMPGWLSDELGRVVQQIAEYA